MKDAIALLPMVSLLLGLVSTVGGFFLYYSGSVRKRYAAERDFQHLLRNQESIVQMLIALDDGVSDLRVEVIRLSSTIETDKKTLNRGFKYCYEIGKLLVIQVEI